MIKPETGESQGRCLHRELRDGSPIRYWRVSSVREERYDVEPVPMSGEMDAQFFLSKKKNFIPHEYPCRTQFAKDHRGQAPDVKEELGPWKHWFPFGSPRVDLSGFWFRPTRISAWAETQIVASEAGEALLELGTCGGAILWVNGEEVHSTSTYQRNFEESDRFKVILNKGVNSLRLFFDDLAERDTRFFFQLTYLSGPAAQVALPVSAAPEVVDEMEEVLEQLHFDKPAYSSGRVRLICPSPARQKLDVNVSVHGEFLYSEHQTLNKRLEKGQTELDLGPIEDFQSDFRQFEVELKSGDFSISRPYTLEITHCEKQGTASEDPDERLHEALGYVAENGYGNAISALARLACGKSGEETERMIAASLATIEDCHDCADFYLVPLLQARIRYSELLSNEICERIDNATLTFRYWMDEPGNDVQWYFSENHALLFHTAMYVGGSFHADKLFSRSGRTGQAQSDLGAQRLRSWFDHFEQWEMAEFNSVPYFPIDLKGLLALYALAHHDDIKQRAEQAILRLLLIVARSAHQGVLTAAQGRSYEHTLMAACTCELSSIARMLWGKGWFGRSFHCLPQLALCIRDHGLKVPAELKQSACLEGDRAQEWCFSQGKNGFAHLYHYKTSRTAMGSLAGYRWNDYGYQETVLHARIGSDPHSQIWVSHPGEEIHCGFGRPSYWGGCGTVPRVHQYKNLAVVEFNVHEDQPDFSHIWFPTDVFAETRIDGKTACGVLEGAFVFVKGGSALELVTCGPSANNEIRQSGRSTLWIFRIGDLQNGQEGKDISKIFAGLQASKTEHGDIVLQDPEYGEVVFCEDGTVTAENRRLQPKDWSIEGQIRHFAANL